ncbi:PD-(D/E)XK nuclease family protein, partial [bacterium]|nr:PD-(D/E)XK nuclease family protein [bacterium]
MQDGILQKRLESIDEIARCYENRIEGYIRGISEIAKLAPKARPRFPKTFLRIIGRSSHETYFSAILAYLLDPGEPHGFGDKILRAFCAAAGIEFSSNDVEVETEYDLGKYGMPDIVIFGNGENILIENKVYSPEGKDQTKRYFRGFSTKFKDDENNYIFLTPEGIKAQSEEFQPLSYKKLVEEINKAITPTDFATIPTMSAGLLADFLQHCKEEFKMGKKREGFSELAKKYWENIKAITIAEKEYNDELSRIFENLPELFGVDKSVWFFHKTKTYSEFWKEEWDFDDIRIRIAPSISSVNDGVFRNMIYVEGKKGKINNAIFELFDKKYKEVENIYTKHK